MNSSEDRISKNPLEWIVFGVSLVLVVVTIGLLAMAAIHSRGGPARLSVSTGKPVVTDNRIDIPVVIRNDGESVAANVEIRIRIGQGADVQEAGFTLDFVPRGANRKGNVTFQGNNPDIVPESRIVGYGEP